MEVPHNYQISYRKKMNTYIKIRDSLSSLEDCYFDCHASPTILIAGGAPVGPIADEVLSRIEQSTMFEKIRPLIASFLRGQDIMVYCFGGSYSGKSFTMFGPGLGFTQSETMYGILPRAVSYIFSILEDGGYRSKDNGIALNISACEFYNKNYRDLLTSRETSGGLAYSTTTKGNRYIDNLTTIECRSASVMMQAVEGLMNNRLMSTVDSESKFFVLNNRGSAMVRIQMSQPGMNGTTVVSQAVFIDLACEVDELPVVDNFGQLVKCPFNIDLLYLFESLKRPEAWGSNYNQNIRYYPLFCFFEDCVKGSVESAVICCLSPSCQQQNISVQYLHALSNLFQLSSQLVMANLRPTDSVESSLPLIEQMYEFGSLTVSEENSEKDQTPLKQDGILERIEEVTESEEEIYSSNEKMSQSVDDDSQTFSSSDSHNSLSESDVEESEAKACQSDENFLDNLTDLCSQFDSFVDSIVNRFETRTVLNPPKERRNSTQGPARRGGVPCVKPQPVMKTGNSTLYDLLDAKNAQTAKPSGAVPSEADKSSREIRRTRTQSTSGKSQSEASNSLIAEDLKSSDKKPEPSKPLDESKFLSKLEEEISEDCLRLDMVRQRLRERREDFEKVDPSNKRDIEPWTSEMLNRLNEVKNAQLANTSHMLALADRSVPTTERGEACLKAQIRNLRQLSRRFSETRAVISKTAKNMFETDLINRDIVVCDAVTTLLDADIEFLNNLLLNNNKSLGKPKSKLEEKAMSTLRRLNVDELSYCLQVAFTSIIDTQTASRKNDAELLEISNQLGAKDDEIMNLRKGMLYLFQENYRLKKQIQRDQGQVVPYAKDRTCSTRAEPSYPTSITIHTGSERRKEPLSIPKQLLPRPTESTHDVKIKGGKVSITKK